eukprot:TRINITY_DN4068_c0_g1_i2.p1 TRINITY_DN4068_c0_g1~~TRINITY_DN4068_c0_g1_i2.p1  ORF type:complete len:238 (-),score=40.02 TRINITY_DN4068_c0_g1_i2:77-790(-)
MSITKVINHIKKFPKLETSKVIAMKKEQEELESMVNNLRNKLANLRYDQTEEIARVKQKFARIQSTVSQEFAMRLQQELNELESSHSFQLFMMKQEQEQAERRIREENERRLEEERRRRERELQMFQERMGQQQRQMGYEEGQRRMQMQRQMYNPFVQQPGMIGLQHGFGLPAYAIHCPEMFLGPDPNSFGGNGIPAYGIPGIGIIMPGIAHPGLDLGRLIDSPIEHKRSRKKKHRW